MKSIAENVVVKLQTPNAWLRKCLAQATSSWSAPIVVALALCVVDARPACAQVDVWTHHNDNIRSGANLAETDLNTSNVNSTQFGKLFEYQVDGPIFGQALVITGLTIPGKGTRNVVFVATMNNSVYAYDADDANTDSGQPIWQVNFNNPAAGVGPVPSQDIGRSQNYNGPYGIMSTPVIDRVGQVIYVVARTKESGTYVYRLHALDITTGQEKTGSPVAIDATYVSSTGTTLRLDAQKQSQRPALAFANGMIYIAWASNEDLAPYQGWVVAYNATTLARVAVFNTAPSGSKAGIWMSGHAPTVDGKGNIYVGVGNGTWDGKENFGQSILKLSPQLALLDWFTPDNWSSTNPPDLDVGSSGILLIPGTQYLTTGSKEGNLYVLDSTNLGHIKTGNTQIPQVLPVVSGGNIHGGPVFWQGPQASLLYVWAEEDYLRAYRFNGFNLDATPASKSAFTAPPGMPGGFLSVSANGSAAGTGIVWASLPLSQDAEFGIMPGVLRAFDANDVSKELWNSASDCLNNVGSFAKYVPPTVANGRVYLSTYSNQLSVYGLLNDAPAADPKLSGTVNCNNTVANLTAVGTGDWVAWPGNVRKASGGTISDYTIVGSASAQTASNVGRVVSWTDGAPTASGSVSSGVSLTGRGNGFQFTAPADTTPRILFVYVGGTSSSGKLIARLSDNSGRVYSATLAGAGQYSAVYKINYAAAGTGQQLIVQWLQTSDAGSITLQAAALSASVSAPLPPSGVSASDATASTVTVSWSASTGAASYSVYRSTTAGTLGSSIGTTSATSFMDSTAVAGTVYYYAVTATGAGGTSAPSKQEAGSAATAPAAPANVSASDGISATSVTVTWSVVTGATTYTVYRSTSSGTLGAAIGSTNSTTLTDSNVTAGASYYYSVVATGVNGSSAPSAQDSGYAGSAPSGSGLQASMVASFNLVNLTQSGTSDWVKWPGAVRKLGGGAQLSDYVKIGPASIQTHNDDQRPVAWSDGTPVASATNDASGVYIAGIGNGFQLSAPADTTTRTLYLYVGGWNSGGKLTAHLSDGSAPDIVDTSFSSSSGQYKVVYTLTYHTASSAQTLVVKWTQASGAGNVTLQAAALAAGAAPAPANGGLLSSSQTLSTVAADLTANGVSDWIKWPTAIRKATGGSQLSDYVKLGAASVSTYSNDIRSLIWSDGNPIASATNDTSGVYIAGIGNGFQVSAPADTTTRTLSVYVGGWMSSGKLIAHLSDGSSPDFVDASFSSSSSPSSTGQYKVVYTLTYRAGSPGQRLVVQWTQNGGTGNVTLQGVAMR